MSAAQRIYIFIPFVLTAFSDLLTGHSKQNTTWNPRSSLETVFFFQPSEDVLPYALLTAPSLPHCSRSFQKEQKLSSGGTTNIKRGTACTNKSRSTLHMCGPNYLASNNYTRREQINEGKKIEKLFPYKHYS